MRSFQDLCPPPRRFRPAGRITHAELSYPPSFVKPKRPKSKAHADGLRYERKAHNYIAKHFEDSCVLGPWFRFASQNNPKHKARIHYCQPDALLIDPREGKIIIIEIKLKHTSDAWWQVRRLYYPVVRYVFGDDWKYGALEVAKWFDADTKFPEHIEFMDQFADAFACYPERFYLHLWKGR